MRSSWSRTVQNLQRSLHQQSLSVSLQQSRTLAASSIPRPKRVNNKNHAAAEASIDADGTGVDDTIAKPKQPFATFKLEPGEWDIDRKDPYHRPNPPPRSRLTSAEDFANRPPVGFENEFSSLDDSMIALSWMDNKTCKQIYKSYTDMMIRMEQENPGRTSHEYVCRVLAQQYQITPWRVAGVIQLQHNEEQMRRNNPELLCEEQARYAEEMILQNISDAYRSDRSENPNRNQRFVEDPVGIHGRGAPDEISSSFVAADDIFDMEAKLKEADERDKKMAQILIDDHVYQEDVDESALAVKMDGAAKRLLKAKQEQQEKLTKAPERDIPYPETNAQGEKRPRWKYVAKVVNTRAMKKKGRRSTSYTNNNTENTLVEEDGNLRVATVEEAKQVAWKPSRLKGNQNIYGNVQRAWLERTLKKKTDVWGSAPRQSAAEAVTGKSSGDSSLPEEEAVLSASEATEEAETAEDDETMAAAAVEGNNDSESSPEEDVAEDSPEVSTPDVVATADDATKSSSEKETASEKERTEPEEKK